MRQNKSLTGRSCAGPIIQTVSLVIIAAVGSLDGVLSPGTHGDDGSSSPRRSLAPASMPGPDKGAQVRRAYGNLPLYFEANRGQSDSQVRFLARASRETLFLTSNEAVLALTEQKSSPHDTSGRSASGAVVRMAFTGANPTPHVTGVEELPGKANYFLGNDPAKWRTGVSTYARVRYDDLYPGVDLIYHGTQHQLEYDLVVRPGADPRRIVLGFEGTDRQELDSRGDLVLYTAAGPIRQRKPVIYQEDSGVRQEITGGYKLMPTHRVGFRVGAYDSSRPLIIDPILSYSTYLGSTGAELGLGIAVDAQGNAYVTGFTDSTDFPTTPGAFQTTLRGVFNVFVTKLNPAGSALVYSTYLGSSPDAGANAIAVDSLGNAYVTGAAGRDFPTTYYAYLRTVDFGGAFVTKLSPTGAALLYSTYILNAPGDRGLAVAVDTLGYAYVTGEVGDFHSTPGVLVTKLDQFGSALVYSTVIEGGVGTGIAVDAVGNAYVTGEARSSQFPTTVGAFQTTLRGSFVAKLDPSGSSLVYATYLGGSGIDRGRGIAVDGTGNAYVTGEAGSADFPTTAGALRTTPGGLGDAFVTKLDPSGSSLVYSTYLGGSDLDRGFGIVVDDVGNAYVTGDSQSSNFPTTTGALQPTLSGFVNAFVTKLNPFGSGLSYSTYLGGGVEQAGSIARDGVGDIYVTGTTYSSDFPTTPGAFQTTRAAPYFEPAEVYVAKISGIAASPNVTVGKVTGGGTIDIPGGIASFGFVVQARSTTGPIHGELQYVNRASGENVHSVTFDSFVTTGNTATFGGTCTNNGTPCTFTVTVQDNGQPGTNDSFTITVDAGPPEGVNENLRSGNVLILQEASSSARRRRASARPGGTVRH